MSKNKFVVVGLYIAVAALMMTTVPAVKAVTIDFGAFTNATSYVEDGFKLSSNATIASSATGNPGPAVFPSTTSSVWTFTVDGGGVFDLLLIDMRELNSTVGSQTQTFVGNLAAGGSVSQTFVTDGACCGVQSGFETFSLGSAFSSLTSVSWDHANPITFVAYDNIVADLVPEPTTLALLGLGLLGIGARRRQVR